MRSFARPPLGLQLWSPILLAVVLVPAASAQTFRAIPSRTYFIAIDALYRGEYRDAERAFQSELRGAIKTPQSRWIDSICYYAMLGETYFVQGRNAEALEQFNNAAKLYLAFPQWMLRVDFPTIPADTNRARQQAPPWGRSQRNATLGRFPDTMSIQQGQFLTEERLVQGGVITPPQLWPINVSEIVRCTALTIRRRNQLLGPLGPHDDISVELANQLRRGGAPPNHWSTAWVDLQLGLAEVGTDRTAEAQKNLARGVVVGGQFDHPLTGVALLEQGKLLLQAGNLQAAAKLFEEASYAAFYFDDPGTVEEALALGHETHLLSGAPGVYPPLQLASEWARRENWRHIQAHFLLLFAEGLAATAQPEAAENVLKTELPRILSRRGVQQGRLTAKYRYLAALIAYQLNRPQAAAEPLAEALAFQTAGSLWNFQIALADRMFDTRRIAGTTARDVYAKLLADPSANDWSHRPMESLGVLSLDHAHSFDRWFLATLDQREAQSAMEVADRAHRRRFLSSLPLGGRLLALQTLLESSDVALPQGAVLERQELLVRFPEYQDLLRAAARIRRDLQQDPLMPADDAQRKEQSQQLEELAELNARREVLLRRMALGRHASTIAFPPALSALELQACLQPGQVLVLFHETQGRMYGFAMTRSDYTSWQAGPVSRVQAAVSKLLRDLGNFDANRQLAADALQDTQWRSTAAETYKLLLGEARLDWAQVDELIIIPDHVLWYLPFEALVEDAAGESEPLLVRSSIRYSPLAAVAVADQRPLRRVSRTAVVVGTSSSREQQSLTKGIFEQLAASVSTAELLTEPLPGPSSLVASLAEELIVFGEIETSGRSVYAWSPVPLGRRGGGGETLADWLQLPDSGPQRVILLGFHTPAEDSLRTAGSVGRPGDDLFAATCGLMAAGAKTILISRWRTGGETAVELAREFSQELPHTSASEAWRRSVLLARERPLQPEMEPRLEPPKDPNAAPKASHPFFWAGYVLADSGMPLADQGPALDAQLPAADGQANAGVQE